MMRVEEDGVCEVEVCSGGEVVFVRGGGCEFVGVGEEGGGGGGVEEVDVDYEVVVVEVWWGVWEGEGEGDVVFLSGFWGRSGERCDFVWVEIRVV